METLTTVLYIFVIALFFSSCNNAYYVSEEVNTLQLSEKKDIKFALSNDPNSLPAYNTNYNFQIGYSPIRNVGLYASQSKKNKRSSTYRSFRQFAVGTYLFKEKPLVVQDSFDTKFVLKEGWLFDFYLGYGRGALHSETIRPTNHYYHFDFGKLSAQSGIHWIGKAYGVSLFYKMNRLNFYQGNVLGKIEGATEMLVQRIIDKQKHTTHEVNLHTYMGFRYLKTYINANLVFNDFNQQEFDPYPLFNFGFILNIDEVIESLKK